MHSSDSLYIGVVFTLFALSIAGFAILGPVAMTGADTEQATMKAAPDYQYSASGKRYTVHPDTFHQLCVGVNCIPSLNEKQTTYESVDAADEWLKQSDMVISIEQDGTAVAYPIPLVQHHFVVNTRVAGEPLLVTYSPHAGYAAAFRRDMRTDLGRQTATFAFTGSLLNGDIIIQDAATETQWNPYRGEAVVGELAATPMQRVDTDVVRWSLWKRTHPNGSVLSRDTGVYDTSLYENNPYFSYRSSSTVPVPAYEQSRLHPKDMVYGVTQRDDASAYREVHVKDLELVEDTIGGTPILIVQNEETGNINGFKRAVDGEPLTFTLGEERRTLQSDDGTTWSLDGEAVDGPLDGHELEVLPLTRMYWYSWDLFNPRTDLYQP